MAREQIKNTLGPSKSFAGQGGALFLVACRECHEKSPRKTRKKYHCSEYCYAQYLNRRIDCSRIRQEKKLMARLKSGEAQTSIAHSASNVTVPCSPTRESPRNAKRRIWSMRNKEKRTRKMAAQIARAVDKAKVTSPNRVTGNIKLDRSKDKAHGMYLSQNRRLVQRNKIVSFYLPQDTVLSSSPVTVEEHLLTTPREREEGSVRN